jgi:hypothetical protein
LNYISSTGAEAFDDLVSVIEILGDSRKIVSKQESVI